MSFKAIFNNLTKTLTALCLAVIGVVGCSEVNYDMGYDFVPESQRMTLNFNTVTGVETYLYRYDSLLSSNMGCIFLGRQKDDTFGARTNSCFVHYLPVAMPYKGGFGIEPIIDSMFLRVEISSYDGDTTAQQKFNIYAVNDDAELYYDSLYYANINPEEYYDSSNLLFTFNYSGRGDIATKLEPTALGREFMNKLVEVDTSVYNNDDKFRSNFKGFYIAPDATSPEKAATYQFNLENAYMQLWLRDHDSIDQAKIKDTLTSWYYFYDGKEYASLSINAAKYDYTGTTLGALQTSTNNFTDTITIQPTIYVQSWGGVTSRLRFPDSLVEKLNSLHYTTDANGNTIENSILINQAMLYIDMSDYIVGDMTTVEKMNKAPLRLGSYLNMKSTGTSGYAPAPIPDYLYDIEKSYQQSDENYMLPYNGYLNRSNGYYELNISSYVQQVMKGSMKQDILLGPSAYEFFGYRQIALEGLTQKPMELSITYTLIKK